MNYQVAVVQLQGTKEAQEDTWRAYSTEGADFSQHLVNGQTIRFPERGGLVLVADGIGGAVGGRIASDLVAGTFCETFRSSFGQRQDQGVSALQNALAAANEALQQKKRQEAALQSGTGCTLIAGIFQKDGALTFLSVGDSPIYRIRDNEIHRVNALHENSALLDVKASEAKSVEAWEYALNHVDRNKISAAVVGAPINEAQIDCRRVLPGDITIFASDGIETLSMELIRRIVAANARETSRKIAAALASAIDLQIQALQRRNGVYQDNVTILVVKAEEDPAAALEQATQILRATGEEAGRGRAQTIPAADDVRGIKAPGARFFAISVLGGFLLGLGAAAIAFTVFGSGITASRRAQPAQTHQQGAAAPKKSGGELVLESTPKPQENKAAGDQLSLEDAPQNRGSNREQETKSQAQNARGQLARACMDFVDNCRRNYCAGHNEMDYQDCLQRCRLEAKGKGC